MRIRRNSRVRRVSAERRTCRESSRRLAWRGAHTVPIARCAGSILFATALLLLGATPEPARAVPSGKAGRGPVEVTADSMRYQHEHGVYVATGNVRVVRERRFP